MNGIHEFGSLSACDYGKVCCLMAKKVLQLVPLGSRWTPFRCQWARRFENQHSRYNCMGGSSECCGPHGIEFHSIVAGCDFLHPVALRSSEDGSWRELDLFSFP